MCICKVDNSNLHTSCARELWIDVLRGIGILAVVLGHSSPPFNKFIYGFHMPLFFLLSGFLWKKKPNTSASHQIVAYLKRYIIPYFILCGINLLLVILIQTIIHRPIPIPKYIVGILYSRGTTEWMPNCSPLWFLTALFVAMSSYELIQRINSHAIRIISVISLGLVSALLSYFEVFKFPWNIDTAMMGIVFVEAGHLLKERCVLETVEKKPLWQKTTGLVVMAILGLLAIIFNPAEKVAFVNNYYGNLILMLFGALSVCFILFYFSYKIKWNGSPAIGLSWIGRHTIFIIGFDYFSESVARVALNKIGFNNWARVFILKVIILSVGCLTWSVCVGKIKNDTVRNMLSF